MTSQELFELITSALAPLTLDLSSERDKRIYLAVLAARQGQGHDGAVERRLEQLREELGL